MPVEWTPSDVMSAAAGDATALARLVAAFQDVAVATAYAQTADFHLAEDAAQEAFALLPAAVGQLRDPAAFPGWFRQVVRTVAVRRRRAHRRREEPAGDGSQVDSVAPEHPERAVEEAEREEHVHRLVEALPAHERVVVSLQYIAGLPQPEIAALLGMPLPTVKKRAYDARQRMRKDLELMQRELRKHRPSRNRRFSDTVLLFRAVKAGDLATVRRLIKERPQLVHAEEHWDAATAVDAGLSLARDGTPLIRAAENNDLPMLELLLDAGADLGRTCGCSTGETALWAAAVGGHGAAVELLLRRGADPNRANARGITPLHAAVMSGDQAVAAMLIAAGADSAAIDCQGRTPADWAPERPAEVDAGREVLQTGIRAIDLFATVPRGGCVRVSGPMGVGVTVTIFEITRLLGLPTFWVGFPGPATDAHAIAHGAAESATGDLVHVLLADSDGEAARRHAFDATVAAIRNGPVGPALVVVCDAKGHHHDVAAAIPTIAACPGVLATFVVHVTADGADDAAPEQYDAHVRFCRRRFDAGVLPAIDPLRSTSTTFISPQHRAAAAGARALIQGATTGDATRELDAVLSQPYLVAQPFSGQSAKATQPLTELIDAVAAIVN